MVIDENKVSNFFKAISHPTRINILKTKPAQHFTAPGNFKRKKYFAKNKEGK